MAMAKPHSRHTQLKRQAAGPTGTTEKPIPGRRRLDARRGNVATEIERSGDGGRLRQAARRLATQKNAARKLLVPQRDMDKAVAAAEAAKVKLMVGNLSQTRRRRVNP